ncbi:MAG: tetratricopeptide repeat protein [Caldilineaceae bacterium]
MICGCHENTRLRWPTTASGATRWECCAGWPPARSALALKDISDYAWLQTSIGRQLFFIGRVDEAVRWLNRARDIFDRQDMMTELAYVHTDLGTSLRILMSPGALAHFHAPWIAWSKRRTSTLDHGLPKPGQCVLQHRKLRARPQRTSQGTAHQLRRNDDQNVASAFNNIGLVLEGLGHLDEARQAYTNALDAFRRIGDETGISACYNNLGSVCFANEDYADALAWYERDLRLSDARGNWTDMAATLHNWVMSPWSRATWTGRRYFTDSRDLYAAFDLLDYVAEEEEMLEYIASLRTPQSAAPR